MPNCSSARSRGCRRLRIDHLVPLPGQADLWSGSITLPSGVNASDLRFIVQAANAAALVGVEDNAAAFHALGGPLAPLAESTIEITSPADGADGSSVHLGRWPR